ncbi:MAG: glutamate--tRNA ligase [Myxococcota bacterium]
MTDSTQIRTRIAPSPTGDPHVGTAYIALFNYVFTKKSQGKFILRIEDTDRTRARRDSEKAIMESLQWLGLNWDEGPEKGGPYGPYRQSERKEIYQEHALKLLEKGEAYRCFCTPARLAELRKHNKGRGTGYDGKCRNISPEESQKKSDAGEPFTLRLKMKTEGDSVFTDELRGQVTRPYSELDDQIILKSDGYPTYHLANVVDDHLMKITHVIRAEEWIPSTPKHVRLYDAFGWQQPKWIHMPLLRNKDKNKTKISKRKNPVSLIYYKEAGFLASALVNFLALMGFNYGDDIEKFTVDEMVGRFSFEKISLGGPVFDVDKLKWLNGLYIREMDENKLLDSIQELWLNRDYFKQLIPHVQKRMNNLNDFIGKTHFFFTSFLDYKTKDGKRLVPKSRDPKEMVKLFNEIAEKIDGLESFTIANLERMLRTLTEEKEWKIKEVFMPVRIAISGQKASPPLFESMHLLGKERLRARLREAANFVEKRPTYFR